MAIKCPIETPHPFQQARGVSQQERLLPTLNPDQVQIDGRSLPELLTFISRLSRQVIYPSLPENAGDGSESVTSGNWSLFFESSLPFLVAHLSGLDSKTLENQYTERREMAQQLRTREGVRLLIWFIYDELIKPVRLWHDQLNQSSNSLLGLFDQEINSGLKQNLKTFIALTNSANRWYGTGTLDFGPWQNDSIWELDVLDLYTFNENFHNESTYHRRILRLIKELDTVSQVFLASTRRLAAKAPNYFNESLDPLKEEYRQHHPPHLGLLFAFLNLFMTFRDNLNGLSVKHLRFFYESVLKIKPHEATPDHVHLILEVARHLQLPYKVDKGVVVKGSKDDNQADILFSLDNEIILDKAKVEARKTLYLNPVADGTTAHVEGVYIAPQAEMADGVKTTFDETGPKFWPTLGSKQANLLQPGTQIPVEYPPARLGWLFASSVLLLEEGKRTITICMACEGCSNQAGEIVDVINAIKDNHIVAFASTGKFASAATKLKNLFIVSLSGKKGWIVPEKIKTELILSEQDNTCYNVQAQTGLHVPANGFILKLTITLNPEDDAVTYFDKAILKEDYSTSLPVIKIELNPSLKFGLAPKKVAATDCSLLAKANKAELPVSLYDYLRYVRLVDTRIKVKVCGVRNLIVQNDESLQDVNSPILPFGSRPKKGSSFYVGSPEMFSKKWERFSLNLDWEGKEEILRIDPIAHPEPRYLGLRSYYHGYEDVLTGIKPEHFENGAFKFSSALLQRGIWKTNRLETPLANPPVLPELFPEISNSAPCPKPDDIYNYNFKADDFLGYENLAISEKIATPSRLDIHSLDGFLRITLQGQDFQHDRYSFVLARQMMALGKFPDVYIGPVYDGFDPPEPPLTAGTTLPSLNIDETFNMLIKVYEMLYVDPNSTIPGIDPGLNGLVVEIVKAIRTAAEADPGVITVDASTKKANPPFPMQVDDGVAKAALGSGLLTTQPGTGAQGILANFGKVNIGEANEKDVFQDLYTALKTLTDKRVVIPKEPYTPTINAISIDYEAVAEKTDIGFVHLYPYEGTYKIESLLARPTLLPTFSQEGYLFIGFSELRPGATLNLLFQLAEATADTELDRQSVGWAYLRDNDWRPLRTGFEIISDKTNGLTRSGIIQLAIPTDISSEKTTILRAPPGGPSDKFIHWLRVSVCSNARAIADTIDIKTQAVQATFSVQPTNDTARLAKAMPAGQLVALAQADSSVSQVSQPYESFGGKPAEAVSATKLSLAFYGRVSERLRHKGRAIDTFDYERLVLEAFPTIFRAKCISHAFGLSASQQFPCEPNPCGNTELTLERPTVKDDPCAAFNQKRTVKTAAVAAKVVCEPARYRRDLELAPGFVLVAVIPDVNTLKGSDRFGPRVPVSLLEEVEHYLKPRLSPFIRLKVMNPRYEAININIEVALLRGNDEVYYRQRLADELRLFFSPWVSGDLDKLAFGQPVRRADLIQFVEQRTYVDFIHGLRMGHQDDNSPLSESPQVNPLTARSILIAGQINVCIYHC